MSDNNKNKQKRIHRFLPFHFILQRSLRRSVQTYGMRCAINMKYTKTVKSCNMSHGSRTSHQTAKSNTKKNVEEEEEEATATSKRIM